MTPAITVGVDPGRTGAVAALDAPGNLIWVEDMPSLTGVAIGSWLHDRLCNEHVDVAWVEQVHAMPKQGVSSVWTFAEGYGAILGALGALHIPVRFVTPAAWKRTAGLSSDKAASRQRATETWPDQSALFARAKDDGRAEAALIAQHGRNQLATATPGGNQ